MTKLEDYLVLNRYMHHLFGADDFETLKNLLRPLNEGPDGTGQSHFYGALSGLQGLKIPADKLALYDRRVMEYEDRLRRRRNFFRGFRYFQYLALLYTEIFLDRLTSDPGGFAADINAFLHAIQGENLDLLDFPDFTADNLRRLAFFMATGSGKTLIMHVNILQVLHYLKRGAHPEAILPGQPQRRAFDNILLITPNEGLSDQHIEELRASGITAVRFIEDSGSHVGILGPVVKVIEIHKLAEKASRDGVSVPIEAIGQNNLVIVDEGHKGTSSKSQKEETNAWKARQKYISDQGLLLEYSATFAQAIAAVSNKTDQKALRQEYGQAILFDYSYAHFYGDGYGKDFSVLNLRDKRPDQAHELLVGGLLAFYHQLHLYRQHREAYRPYNIEKPLWVMLGSSVKGLERRSDVAEVVAFIQRFTEDRGWAIATIDAILKGESGFVDEQSQQDLFVPYIEYLQGENAEAVYNRLLDDVFHGRGGLEVYRLKQAEGELGLRLSTSLDEARPYFGVINIGDVPAFVKYLAQHVGIQAQEDNFRPSLFDQVDDRDSPIYLLIGAKKFIEGWSSWRVSSMGLLNVGKGAGPQIIQLFGRGVRLKGKNMSLKRSSALALETGEKPPKGIHHLETLTIFGWNANYIQTFRKFIEAEDIGKVFTLPTQKKQPWPVRQLPVPRPPADFDANAFIWSLDTSGPKMELDLTPKLAMMTSSGIAPDVRSGGRSGVVELDFSRLTWALDLDRLYLHALRYKQTRGYANLLITAEGLPAILNERCTVWMPESDMTRPSVQNAAERAITTYMDRFMRMKEREAQSKHATLAYLEESDPQVLSEYRIQVKGKNHIESIETELNKIEAEIEQLLQNSYPVFDPGEPLPRLYFHESLFNPLLTEGGPDWKRAVSVSPAPLNTNEKQFLKDLRAYWKAHHDQPPLKDMGLYVLRNLSRSGIGLFHRSGFYPDFILWLVNGLTGHTRVIFVDPHGLHHHGLSGTEDKFKALEALRELSKKPVFADRNIAFDGYILTPTPLDAILDRNGRSKEDLERQYPLVFQDASGEYVPKIMGIIS